LYALNFRAATVDDLAPIRRLQSAAARHPPLQRRANRTLEAIAADPLQPDVIDTLRGQALQTAWLDGRLVAVAGWIPTDDGVVARLVSVAVDPLFMGLGIGHAIVRWTEDHARRAGFTHLTVAAPAHLVGFYRRLRFTEPAAPEQGMPDAAPPQLLCKALRNCRTAIWPSARFGNSCRGQRPRGQPLTVRVH